MKYDHSITQLENHARWGIDHSTMVEHNVFTILSEYLLRHHPEQIHILFEFDIDHKQYGGKDDPMLTLITILSGNTTDYQLKKYHKLAYPTLSNKLHQIYQHERDLYLKRHPEMAA